MLLYEDLYEIYIPTYGRAGKMLTHEIFPEAVIVCPESQLQEYQKHYPGMSYMPCPDDVEGNMATKRQWIKENARKDWFIMCDDDLKYFQMVENRKASKLEGEHLRHIFLNAFIMCEELGTVLWGINLQTDPMFYKETSPFSLLSVVLGPFSGHIKEKKCKYDEKLPTKEDYDYSLQVLYHYKKVLRFNKYAYMANHINNEGGSVSIRRMKWEEEQNRLLQKKWGKKVVKYDMAKDIDPIVKIPLKGI